MRQTCDLPARAEGLAMGPGSVYDIPEGVLQQCRTQLYSQSRDESKRYRAMMSRWRDIASSLEHPYAICK